MPLRSTDYAMLAQDSYLARARGERVKLDGFNYEVVAHTDNPKTGFQATAYRSADSAEVVIAYRGTEFDREPTLDGLADIGMALAGGNLQSRDSDAFTRRVLAQVKADAAKTNHPVEVTVTGHSLGGTLAQLEAHKFGLKGETFNAYGAAGLAHGVPEGGHQVVNHVRAGDVVSAASAHFGEVRVYAVQQDVDTLNRAGYRDNLSALSARNPAKASDFGAHAIDNFVPNSKTLGESILSSNNQLMYQANHVAIDRYRSDIQSARTIASMPLQTGLEAGQLAGRGVRSAGVAAGQAFDSAREQVEFGVRRAGQALEQTGDAVRNNASRAIERVARPGQWFSSQVGPGTLLNEPGHPGHALFKQAEAGMQAIDAKFGRASDHLTENAAGAVAAKAHSAGMTRIDHMDLAGAQGDLIVAAQGKLGTAHSKVIDVSTTAALNTPLAQSSQAFADAQSARQAAVPPLPQPEQSFGGPAFAARA